MQSGHKMIAYTHNRYIAIFRRLRWALRYDALSQSPGRWPAIFILLAIGIGISTPTAALEADHRLSVKLIESASRLVGSDTITVKPGGVKVLNIYLNPAVFDLKVSLDGRSLKADTHQGRLHVPLPSSSTHRRHQLKISYAITFNDPIPYMPINTDNPGFGVIGAISEKGTFLLAGAGWYPEIVGSQAGYRLTVTAPQGVIAVTAGRSLGVTDKDGTTISQWDIRHPIDGLALSAARYVIGEKRLGDVTVATYFFEDNQHLSARYLKASADYIRMYEGLFGPYPFDKFAVVENFFPTGYGFPSYTLLGSRVLRLPFILRTSLGHEIAHCWWGNGVYVDYRDGNWSEGLTTYVADYLYKENTGADDAIAYRQQMLRNYATLISRHNDFALHAFRSRTDRATKTIGYDKSAMVFHMLRRQIGERAFWGALKDLYRERLFQPTSWRNLQTVFERQAGKSLDTFFDQWLNRSGAPQLFLQQPRISRAENRWVVKGQVHQSAPHYALNIPVVVETATGRRQQVITLNDDQVDFKLMVDEAPLRVMVDPDAEVFRRLHPVEIPPSINSLKGSDSLQVVVAESADAQAMQTAEMLVAGLGIQDAKIHSENRVSHWELKKSDVLFIGFTRHADLLQLLPSPVELNTDAFRVGTTVFDDAADIFFGVVEHPYAEDKVVAQLLPLSGQYLQSVARKITHYGKYSYLAFRKGVNRIKGVWPVVVSPLIHTFQEN